jgi:hypothetical protein
MHVKTVLISNFYTQQSYNLVGVDVKLKHKFGLKHRFEKKNSVVPLLGNDP